MLSLCILNIVIFDLATDHNIYILCADSMLYIVNRDY